MATKLFEETICNPVALSEFSDEFSHYFLKFMGKTPFSVSTPNKTFTLYVNGQNFMGYKFARETFLVRLNEDLEGKKVRIECGWFPTGFFHETNNETWVVVYYHVSDKAKYKPDHVRKMVFNGFLYSLFIESAINFNKISRDVARGIFTYSDMATKDFHISAIVVRSSLRLSANTYEFNLLANRHYATLNSQFFARHFEFKNIMHNTDTYKVLSLLLDKRFGQTELQEHLIDVFVRHFSNE